MNMYNEISHEEKCEYLVKNGYYIEDGSAYLKECNSSLEGIAYHIEGTYAVLKNINE